MNSIKPALTVTALGLLAATPSSFADARSKLDEIVMLNIDSKDTGCAINDFSEQIDLPVIASGVSFGNHKTKGLRGKLRGRTALKKLLKGTGLTYETDGDFIIIKSRVPAPPLAANVATVHDAGSTTTDDTRNRVPETVEVLGSHILESSFGGPVAVSNGQQVITLSRDDIVRTGYETVQQVMQTLPQNFAGGPSELTNLAGGSAESSPSYGASLNFRGLGAGATLSMVNGHRITPSGAAQFVDIASIPVSALQRIEILPDGASATYGADAVGGVVNFVFLKEFQGFETKARCGSIAGQSCYEYSVAQTAGRSWDQGNLLASYEVFRRDALPAADRPYTVDSDLRRLGGSNFSSRQSNPGNITAVGDTSVNLAIPRYQNGMELDASQFDADRVNFQNRQSGAHLLPGQERRSLVFNVYQHVGRAELFSETWFSTREFIANTRRGGISLIVPESNFYRQQSDLFRNQGNLVIGYNLIDDLGPIVQSGNATALQTTAGSYWHGASWTSEFSATYGKYRERVLTAGLIDSAALKLALASSSIDSAFNPFGEGSHTLQSVLDALTRSSQSVFDNEQWIVRLRGNGAMFELPAGSVKVALGTEVRKLQSHGRTIDTFSLGTSTAAPSPAGQELSRAIFSEAQVPIAGPPAESGKAGSLSATLAARYEVYENRFGDTLNPHLDLRWYPADGFALVGSYGTSFNTPTFEQLNRPRTGLLVDIPVESDPNATGNSTSTWVMFGGNSELEPERATTLKLSMIWTLEQWSRAQFRLDRFDTRFTNRIVSADLRKVFAQPSLYSQRLIRNPTRAQFDAAIASTSTSISAMPNFDDTDALLDLSARNLAELNTAGFDLQFSYAHIFNAGTFRYALNATKITKYEERTTQESTFTSLLNTVGQPVDLRLRSTFIWSREDFDVSVFINYTDGYRDNVSVPHRKIDSWIPVDFQLRVPLSRQGDTFWRGTTLSVSVLNVFDDAPPFVNNSSTGMGFDPVNASPLGRFAALTIKKTW